MAKQLTYARVAERKRKAEQFLRDVEDDDERADEVADESVEAYGERRHFEIIDNPEGRPSMANGNGDSRTKAELLDEIDQLQHDNQDLQDQLDAIAEIIGTPDEGDEDDYDDGDDDQD